jgi:hypothetical protein
MRAVEVADSLLRAGRYRNALILGVEAGMQETILPRSADAEVEEHHLAGFTLGEAATAMLVEADDAPPPEIVLRSDGDEVQTCLIPLPGVGAFLPAGADPPPAAQRRACAALLAEAFDAAALARAAAAEAWDGLGPARRTALQAAATQGWRGNARRCWRGPTRATR